MRKLVGLLAVCVGVAAFLPGRAAADDACTPDPGVMSWIDAAPPDLAPVFGRPGLVIAVGSGDFPAQLRQQGAETIHWDNYLRSRVGLPTTPMDPDTIVDRANRLFDYAVQQSGCATPWIAENELSGAGLESPWSATNTQYRQNVLTYLQTLAARGARPFLLVSSAPYTGGEAAAWWQQVAAVADIVREDYFSDKRIHALGPIVGPRTIRESIRASVGRFLAIGIPANRLGVMLGFQSNTSNGGRAGLEPPQAWFEVVKWQALAAKQVAQELHFSSVWSWGWTSYTGNKDPDFGKAACVWLWVRSSSLCNGPGAAGAGWNSSLTEGQLVFPSGTQCFLGKDRISQSSISQLEALTGDHQLAYTAVFARTIESRLARVTQAQVLTAERGLIANRFAGSRAAYQEALSEARVSLPAARAIIGDELRRELLERRRHAPAPTAAQIQNFYESYPDMLVRQVKSKPAPWWLEGKAKGYALEVVAPEGVFRLGRRAVSLETVEGTFAVSALGKAQPLGTMPLSVVAPAIRVALATFARGDAFDDWTTRVQTAELANAVCRGDDLPAPGPAQVSTFVPFLAVGATALN